MKKIINKILITELIKNGVNTIRFLESPLIEVLYILF